MHATATRHQFLALHLQGVSFAAVALLLPELTISLRTHPNLIEPKKFYWRDRFFGQLGQETVKHCSSVVQSFPLRALGSQSDNNCRTTTPEPNGVRPSPGAATPEATGTARDNTGDSARTHA